MYSRIIPSRMDRRGSARRTAFNGNFASLFPGAYQVLQSDRGLTYGGTMLANAGNTSTATMALTGSLATAPVPIWIRLTGVGATADIYYDGLGVTPAISGAAVLAGLAIPLTSAGTGLSITPSAGTLVVGDTWKANTTSRADQSGNGKDFTQGAHAQKSVVGVGVSGKASALFQAANLQNMGSALVLPTPSVQPRTQYAVFRVTGDAGGQCNYQSSSGFGGVIYSPSGTLATQVQQFNAGGANPIVGRSVGTIYRVIQTNTNSVADTLRVGSVAVTGQNAGNQSLADFYLGGTAATFNGNVEYFLSVWMPGAITSFTAADAAVAAYYGPTVEL